MDLMTLDANNQPAKLIENYDSLIWTERYIPVGDFQLTTSRTKDFLNLLPEGTRLTLRETNQVMVVETHQITRRKGQAEKLVITGRSFESILDRRIAIQSVSAVTGGSPWSVAAKTPSDVAWYVIDQIVRAGLLSSKDIFPSSMVQFPVPSDYGTSTGPSKNFVVERGNLLKVVVDLLQTEMAADPTTVPATPAVVPHGIRAVRPNSAGTAIGVQIYLGTDKTNTVYFDATRDLLDDGAYLFSKIALSNAAYGVGTNMGAYMYEGAVEPSGLDRRVALIDGSGSELTTLESLRNYMSMTLAEASETAIFEGKINEDLNPYKFGVDYNLGDIVKVVGDYGLNANARITEYIRTEDVTGEKAYPTLETIPA